MKRSPFLMRMSGAMLRSILLTTVVFFFVAPHLHAQTSLFSVDAFAKSVEDGAYPGEKNPTLAGVLEYLFPTLGFAYSGDWTRGLLPAGVAIAGIGVLGYTFWYVNEDDPEANALLLSGGLLFLGGRIWSIVGAVDAAKDYNENLPQRARLGIVPSDGGLRIGIGFRF